MALRTRKLGSNSKHLAKPRRIWVKVVPLVAALAIGGAVAAKTIFSGKKDGGAEVRKEKKTREEKRKEEKKEKYRKKLEILKRAIQLQKMKERGEISFGGREEPDYFPSFDEKQYRKMLADFEKGELWELFGEQCGIIRVVRQEHRDVLDDMDIDLLTGKRVPTEEQEDEKGIVVARLEIEKRKQDLILGRVHDIEISEYGLAGKSREELLVLEDKAILEEDSVSWEEEQTMYLASIALNRMFWNEIFPRKD